MKIQLTNVYVKDPQEAFQFYTEILGFLEQLYLPEANLAIVVSPEEPNGTALLLEPSGNPIAENYREALYKAGFPAIVFGVKDIDEEFGRLTGMGVKFTKEPTKTDWGFEAILDDTCGNLIQLAQSNRIED